MKLTAKAARRATAAALIAAGVTAVVGPPVSGQSAGGRGEGRGSDAGGAERLQALQKEKLATLTEAVARVEKGAQKSGAGALAVVRAKRRVAEAEFDMAGSDKDRAAALEKVVALARETEQLVGDLARRGSGTPDELTQARVARLDAEIDLEKLRAGLPVVPAAGRRQEPNGR